MAYLLISDLHAPAAALLYGIVAPGVGGQWAYGRGPTIGIHYEPGPSTGLTGAHVGLLLNDLALMATVPRQPGRSDLV